MALSVQNPTLNPKGVEPLRVEKSGMDRLLQGMQAIQLMGSIAGSYNDFKTLQAKYAGTPQATPTVIHKDLMQAQPQYMNPRMNQYRGQGQALASRSPLYSGIYGA